MGKDNTPDTGLDSRLGAPMKKSEGLSSDKKKSESEHLHAYREDVDIDNPDEDVDMDSPDKDIKTEK